METASLARFIVDTRFKDLPGGVVRQAKLCFLDWLGSAYAGSSARPTRILHQLIWELGGVQEATVVASGRRTSCLYAAMANAASSHVVEMDDLDKASIYHPGAAVIPAALSIAERQSRNGAEFIRAIVLGYEASIRIGEAVNPSHYRYWHTTGTVGTFGAAVAAGVLLGLDREQMTWALGSAGTQAAGLWEFLVNGAMSKQLHPAKAAMNGVLSALLAREGFTAATRILEGDKGFCRATASEYDLARITQGLAPGMGTYKISKVSFKKHASCRHTHPAIDATLELIKSHSFSPEDIAQITVKVYTGAMELLGKVEASTPYAAKFNLPYCVATAAVHKDVSMDRFSEEYLRDRRVRSLMERVVVEADPGLDRLYPEKWPSVVEIQDHRGERFAARVDYPKGDPENPLSEEELCAKFRGLVSPFLEKKQAERYMEKVFQLETIDDMSTFFAL